MNGGVPLSGRFAAPVCIVTAAPIPAVRPTSCVGAVVDRIDLGDHAGCALAPERWRDGGLTRQLTAAGLARVQPGHRT